MSVFGKRYGGAVLNIRTGQISKRSVRTFSWWQQHQHRAPKHEAAGKTKLGMTGPSRARVVSGWHQMALPQGPRCKVVKDRIDRDSPCWRSVTSTRRGLLGPASLLSSHAVDLCTNHTPACPWSYIARQDPSISSRGERCRNIKGIGEDKEDERLADFY